MYLTPREIEIAKSATSYSSHDWGRSMDDL